MDNEKQRENCLKEVQLHQVSLTIFNHMLVISNQSLDHPNIVRYLNWFIDSKLNELFIAVEWAEKGDLKLVIKKAIEEDIHFHEKKVWDYIHQIASAL